MRHATRGQFAAVQYTSQARDQALVFFWYDQVFGGSHPPLRLCHLKPNALYRIEPLRALPTASPLQEYPAVLSGAALMATGLPPLLDYWQTHASYLVKLTEITVLSTWRTHLPKAERYDRTSGCVAKNERSVVS